MIRIMVGESGMTVDGFGGTVLSSLPHIDRSACISRLIGSKEEMKREISSFKAALTHAVARKKRAMVIGKSC